MRTPKNRLAKIYEIAEKHLTTDPALSAYVLRDLPEIEELGLDDLAFEMSRYYCTKAEAEELLNKVRAVYPVKED